ncbi:MAG: glycosyltransferase family 4 protein, partial [Planctomycetaceae bacterium]
MKRALLITDIFPPDIGGPATFIERLAGSLTDRGVSATVMCATPADDEAQDASRPYRVHRVPGRGRSGFGLRLRCALTRRMLSHRHILVNGLEPYACSVAQVTGRRYVLKVVGDSVWETARNSGQTHLPIGAFQSHDSSEYRTPRLVRSRWLNRATAIITPSQYLADLVSDWGTNGPRIHVVHNGVTRSHRGEPEA